MKGFVVVIVECVFDFIFKKQDNLGCQVKENFWEMILNINVMGMLLKGDSLFAFYNVFNHFSLVYKFTFLVYSLLLISNVVICIVTF